MVTNRNFNNLLITAINSYGGVPDMARQYKEAVVKVCVFGNGELR